MTAAPDVTREGVLLVDKPRGPTSHDVIAKLRRALGTRALGHAGTLDPMATGLLVVLAGRYTRLSAYLTSADKEYLAAVTFGARTTTDDAEGDVVERADPAALDEERVRRALASMVGPQRQRAPAFSAIQVGGERLYDKARRGEAVEAPVRDVVLHELALLSFRSPVAEVRVRCSKGTYVRAVARDLGEQLGVPAHLSALRRTRSGGYSVDDARPLDAILAGEGELLTGPRALRGIPLVEVSARDADALAHGRAMPNHPGLPEGSVAVAHEGERLVAIVGAERDSLRPVRGFG